LLVLLAGCQVVFAPDVGDSTGDDVGDDAGDDDTPEPDAPPGGFNTPVEVNLGSAVPPDGWVTDPALTFDESQLAYRLVVGGSSTIRVAQRMTELEFPTSDELPVGAAYAQVPELGADGTTIYYAESAGAAAETDIAIASRSSPTATDWKGQIPLTNLNGPLYDYPGGPTADELRMIVLRSDPTTGAATLVELARGAGEWLEVPTSMTLINMHEQPNNAQLSPDGLRVVFSSFEEGTSDLYVASRATLVDTFINITPLFELNTVEANESDPWLSADGDRLYFSRGTTEADTWIWYSERTTP
jgi:hypothetical protein